MKHIIAMNCRINQLTEEHQVTIIRLINHLASHKYEYQVHAMNRIEKIQLNYFYFKKRLNVR